MDNNITLLKVKRSVVDILTRVLSPELTFNEVSDVDLFLKIFVNGTIQTNVLVIGDDISNPVRVAQQIFYKGKSTKIYILCAPVDLDRIQKSLMFTPYIGSDVIPWSTSLLEDLPDELRYAFQESVFHESHRQTVASLKRNLDKLDQSPSQLAHFLDRLIDHIPSGICTIGHSRTILDLNHQAATIFGSDEKSVIGTPLNHFFVKSAHHRLDNMLVECSQDAHSKTPTEIFEMAVFNQKVQFVEVTAAFLSDRQECIIILQDITDRIDVETKLKSSHVRLEILVDETRRLSSLHDRFQTMVEGICVLLQVIPLLRFEKASFNFRENLISGKAGYAAFEFPIIRGNDGIPLPELDNVEHLSHTFSKHPTIQPDPNSEALSSVCAILHQQRLRVFLIRDHLLLGAIQIDGIDDLTYDKRDNEFVTTLSQFLAISLENQSHTLDLEQNVYLRTKEIQSTLKQLEEQHQELKETQSHLIQAEKMASLGTLVSGMAHEINNPVNFVYGGIENIKSQLTELRNFIFDVAGDNASPVLQQGFEDRFSKLFGSVKTVKHGAHRVKTIVEDLRTFSRINEAERKVVHLVENLESTLRLIQAEHHGNIKFVCDFQENPQMVCWPAQLNQVFFNILVNSCQAIEGQGTILIRTRLENGSVVIDFKDDGCGMAQEVQSRMFEPFFSTKPVGAGTGLGLSLAYGIVKRHEGSLWVKSEPNQGTTLSVSLPIRLE